MAGKIRVWPRRLETGYFLTRIASFADATWLCGTLRAAGYDAHDPVRHDRFDVPKAWRLYVSDLTSVDPVMFLMIVHFGKNPRLEWTAEAAHPSRGTVLLAWRKPEKHFRCFTTSLGQASVA
jgi:hypothetical protein